MGYVDAIEIKRPDIEVIRNAKVRNNYIPSKHVSDTAIQLENYLYSLNRWGSEGEKELTKRYRKYLPQSIDTIKIANPRGIIIMGQSTELNVEQIHTLELVKRHYARITDLITYNDLVTSLERAISSLKEGSTIIDDETTNETQHPI